MIVTRREINQTKIAKWSDVDNFRSFPSLQELRIRGCPLMEEYTAHERRSLLVARYVLGTSGSMNTNVFSTNTLSRFGLVSWDRCVKRGRTDSEDCVLASL